MGAHRALHDEVRRIAPADGANRRHGRRVGSGPSGSIVGAFAVALLGAFVFEYTSGTGHGTATRVAWGALIGRVVAAALKTGIGLVMAVWSVIAAFSAT